MRLSFYQYSAGILMAISLLSACSGTSNRTNNSAGEKSGKSEKFDQVSAAGKDNMISLSPEAIANASIKSQPLKEMTYESDIKTTGELKADENHVFHINSMVGGRITEDRVNLGDLIHQGQTLAVVQNLEVTKLIGDYIHQKHSNEILVSQISSRLDLANKNLERLSKLADEGIAPQKDVLTSRNAVDQLNIELRGVKEHDIHLSSETEAMLSAYGKHLKNYDSHKIESDSPLTAPRAGIIIKKTITLGDVVNTSEPLYVVADLSDIWLDITIYDKDLSQVKTGQSVTFISDSLAGRRFEGKISYIQPLAGDATRTFLARAVLPNRNLLLKPGMFGNAVIHTRSKEILPYVADNAIQRYGKDVFVFEDLGHGKFRKCSIELGDRLLDGHLVKSGIASGVPVVNSGSLTLKAELLRRINGSADD